MFGRVFRYTLLTAVFLTALLRSEETVQFSPWCSIRVPVRHILLLPRPTPPKRHRRFESSRLYLVLLLLLLAGDIEINPGPAPVGANEETTDKSSSQTVYSDSCCDSCGLPLENLTLRSRSIKGTVIGCVQENCNRVIHHYCKDGEINNTDSKWTCSMHAINGACTQAPELSVSPRRTGFPAPEEMNGLSTDSPQDSPPGPSFISVNLMDVMEAVRITQLKVDRLSNDMDQIKQLLQALQAHDRLGLSCPTRHDPSASNDGTLGSSVQRQSSPASSAGEQHSEHRCKESREHITPDQPHPVIQSRSRQTTRSQSLLVIGDSNVRRLQARNDFPNTTFHSIPGGTTDHVARDITHMMRGCSATHVTIHIGTNDLTHRGSERIAKDILDLAKLAKSHDSVRHVDICSVIPRSDLGSFVFSRSESVNNRLRSLCLKTENVNFIDLRHKLEGCQFNGLFRDCVHYNNAGAAQAIRTVMDSAGYFFA